MLIGYFSSTRDRGVIEAGGFWCEVCLISKPATEQSPDKRCCQGCYDFLAKERRLDRATAEAFGKDAEGLIVGVEQHSEALQAESLVRGSGSMGIADDSAQKRQAMRSIRAQAAIGELALTGMSSRKIVMHLASRGVEVSQSTVARVSQRHRKGDTLASI